MGGIGIGGGGGGDRDRDGGSESILQTATTFVICCHARRQY